MKPAVLEFERAMEDLAQLVAMSAIEEELLKADTLDVSPERVRELLLSFRKSIEPFVVRQSQYAMEVVLLYSAFERLIEGLLSGAVSAINELVPSYNEVPSRIQDSHRRKTIDALRDDVWLGRNGDPDLAAKLIEGLASCESRASNYRLNSQAYGRHGANFRRTLIDDLFRDVGVDNFLSMTAQTMEFQAYLSAAVRERGLLDSEFGAVDDLAERRNEIAHGGPSELLTRNQVSEYIAFFNAFSRSAYAALRRHLARFLVAHHATFLATLREVHYRKVFCLELGVLPEGTWIEVDDPLAVDMGTPVGYEIGAIVNIRTEDGDVRKCRSEKGLTVCFETSLRLVAGRRIYLVNRDCPASWMLE